MALFASRTPRDLNHDPYPVRIAGRTARSKRMLWPSDVMDPRPEFDHVQHSEPNPILVNYRETRSTSPDGEWERWFRREYNHDTDSWVWDDASITEAHIDHARRVLTRLARLEARS